jgi:excisionase family DNA binding protein
VRYLLRMDTLLLSKQEAARLLGLSIRSLEHLISRKEILVRRIGRRVLIARAAVESFAKAQISDESSGDDTACAQPRKGARRE